MGHVIVKVIIRGKEEYVANLPVDTGASFTVLPLKLAEKLLYKTSYTVKLRLGDRRRVTAQVYVGEVEVEGRKGPVRTLAMPKVIGIDTLETLGLKVDPTTGKIEKTEHYMLYV